MAVGMGSSTSQAYGGGYLRVHRFAWELLNGPIPDGPTIDHLCRNTLCVKPAHLEVVTQQGQRAAER
jgi:HNH endonuclease